MNGLLQDARYAVRQLRKSPGFTAVAVLTLALGIGANTAIFSILDPLLLRQLPVRNPGELVCVTSAGSLGPAEAATSEIQSFYVYRDKAQVFSDVIAYTDTVPHEISRNGRTIPAQGEVVSGNYFIVLGVRSYAGRLFGPSEDRASSGAAVAVLSFDYWKRAFNSDPAIVGQTMTLDHLLYTIIGVTPPEFFGTEVGKSPDFYLPFTGPLPTADQWRANPVTGWVTVLARLKPGVSLAQAEAGLGPLFQQLGKTSTIPDVERREFFARPVLIPAGRGLSELRTQFSLPARILMAVVGLVLLIACTNVANLLLARSMDRKREINVRLALGAGRSRLVRQLLTESMLLAVMGGAAGLLVGRWASALLVAALSTERSPVTLASGIDGRVLLFTAAVLALTVLLCGLMPALSATRADFATELKGQTADSTQPSRSRVGRLLIVGQVALSVVLLAGAGLLVHSLINLETFNPGFDRDHVLLVSIDKPTSPTGGKSQAFYDQLLERVKSLPDVRSASYSSFAPVSGREVGINVAMEGHPLLPGEEANVRFVGVSAGYFKTLGIPLLQGRVFTPQDSQQPPRVAILNHTMARRFFGSESPLGKQFKFIEGNRPPVEIVGVVADSKYNNLREDTLEFFYLPSERGQVLEVRVGGNPILLAGSVRGLVHSVNASATVTSIKALREQVDESLHQDRLIVALCGIFSLLALVLTGAGLYGALAFSVARRTREIGIRMALGARPEDIFRLVVGEGMLLTIAGLLLGVGGAIAAIPLFRSLLFGVKLSDPVASASVLLLLAIAGAVACYIPARRAAKVDPMVALRYE